MDAIPAAPFGHIETSSGPDIPWYVIPFAEDGTCTAPETRQHLLTAMADGEFTDTFLFSHGWNNTWPVALERYEDFIRGFINQRHEYSISVPDPYRPALVGVFWPSTSLVGADEHAPKMAAGQGESAARIDQLIEAVNPAQRERLATLLAEDELDETEALEVAAILQEVYQAGRDEIPDDEAIDPSDIVAMWRAAAADQPGSISEDAAIAALKQPGSLAGSVELQAAGRLGLRTRDIARLTTIWRMKDRAAVVGGGGVSRLLADLLADTSARIHLIGHSLGAKVLLSATAGLPQAARNVRSLLLLQPAVSHLCFAPRLPKRRGAGGYVQVPDRVDLPVLTTHSRNDFPLHKTFHLALRRRRDLGEKKVAAPGAPPSIHAALGGYGPRGREDVTTHVDVELPTSRYSLDPATKLISVDGTAEINDHGDVSNPATWWMLHNLVLAGETK